MEHTGEQLHPNWRALATVHIPMKRFIKEGTQNVDREQSASHKRHAISGVMGDEIKEFYEELVVTTDNPQNQNIVKGSPNKLGKEKISQQCKPKTSFEVRKYFRLAMENKVDELKNMDFEGQNLNVCDNYGWSALMMASCEGAHEAVHFLLTLGVDRCIKDKSGRVAKDLAYSRGHYKIVDLLEKNQCELKESIRVHQEKTEKQEPFYCNICKQNFKETTRSQHYTSTVHQINIKSDLPPNKLQKFNISSRNKGLQLMVKQGWDKESGLGPSQSGRLYPVKTVIRKQRTGLGTEQGTARVTHFESYDYKAVQSRMQDYGKKRHRNRNDIRREKLREWKRNRRLRNELN